MSFVLQYQTTSSTQIQITPEVDYKETDEKIQTLLRTEAGAELRYKWGEFGKREFSLRYVNTVTKGIVNSWWSSNAELLFMRNDGTEVFSCKMLGNVLPIGQTDVPYAALFKGKIILGTY